jgi:hypothetical protein
VRKSARTLSRDSVVAISKLTQAKLKENLLKIRTGFCRIAATTDNRRMGLLGYDFAVAICRRAV